MRRIEASSNAAEMVDLKIGWNRAHIHLIAHAMDEQVFASIAVPDHSVTELSVRFRVQPAFTVDLAPRQGSLPDLTQVRGHGCAVGHRRSSSPSVSLNAFARAPCSHSAIGRLIWRSVS